MSKVAVGRAGTKRGRLARQLVRYMRIVCRDETVLVTYREACEASGAHDRVEGVVACATLLEPRMFETDADWYVDLDGRRRRGARYGLRAPIDGHDAFVPDALAGGAT